MKILKKNLNEATTCLVKIVVKFNQDLRSRSTPWTLNETTLDAQQETVYGFIAHTSTIQKWRCLNIFRNIFIVPTKGKQLSLKVPIHNKKTNKNNLFMILVAVLGLVNIFFCNCAISIFYSPRDQNMTSWVASPLVLYRLEFFVACVVSGLQCIYWRYIRK